MRRVPDAVAADTLVLDYNDAAGVERAFEREGAAHVVIERVIVG